MPRGNRNSRRFFHGGGRGNWGGAAAKQLPAPVGRHLLTWPHAMSQASKLSDRDRHHHYRWRQIGARTDQGRWWPTGFYQRCKEGRKTRQSHRVERIDPASTGYSDQGRILEVAATRTIRI